MATPSGPEGETAGLFPPFDPSTFGSQLFWLVITFGILYYVMAKIALPRVGSILENRSNRIETDIAEAQRLKDETDAAIAEYEQALAEARKNASEISQGARDKAQAETDQATAKIEAELEKKLADAETKISAIRTIAMGEVDGIASDTAAELVKSIVGGRVTKAELTAALKEVGA